MVNLKIRFTILLLLLSNLYIWQAQAQSYISINAHDEYINFYGKNRIRFKVNKTESYGEKSILGDGRFKFRNSKLIIRTEYYSNKDSSQYSLVRFTPNQNQITITLELFDVNMKSISGPIVNYSNSLKNGWREAALNNNGYTFQLPCKELKRFQRHQSSGTPTVTILVFGYLPIDIPIAKGDVTYVVILQEGYRIYLENKKLILNVKMKDNQLELYFDDELKLMEKADY